jgi:beta-lactamase regulating signal transducer with metallopeptidase domain/biopolymer transport protein ExbD
MTPLLNDLGGWWGSYFGLAVLQNTIFLLGLFALLRVLRRAPAGLRYAVGALGVLKLLLPPFLPARSGTIPVSPAEFPGETFSTLPFLQPSPGTLDAPALASPSLSLPGQILLLWGAGVLVYYLLSATSSVRLAMALRHATPIDPGTLADLGLGSRLHIRSSPRISMPLTFGLFPRTIFVPPGWEAWTPACRRAVIRHETAHLRRLDGIFQMIQVLARGLYFFHPLAWLLDRRMHELREMACDDRAAGSDPRARLEYSRRLIEIVESAVHAPPSCGSATTLIRRKHELLHRVRYQTEEGIMSPISRTKRTIILASSALLVLPFSWYACRSTPDAGAPGRASSSHSQFLDVSLQGADRITIDGTETTLSGLAQDLESAAGDDRDELVVRLICDEQLAMDILFAVQDRMLDLDLRRVSYVSQSGRDLPLLLPPPHDGDPLRAVSREDIASLSVTGSGEVYLDGEPIGVPGIESAIRERLARNEYLVVSIEVGKTARYGDFVSVLEQAKSADAHRISINEEG